MILFQRLNLKMMAFVGLIDMITVQLAGISFWGYYIKEIFLQGYWLIIEIKMVLNISLLK